MGMAAGIIAAWCAAPFDFIRTLQQAHVVDADKAGPNIFHVVRTATKTEGIRALWSGSTATMSRAAVFTAAQLVSYDKSKLWMANMLGLGVDEVPTHIAASLVSGAFTTVCTAPFEMVKTYMQMNCQKGIKDSVWGSVQVILRKEGLPALWRGTTPLYLKIAPHTFIVLVLTEQFRHFFGVPQVI